MDIQTQYDKEDSLYTQFNPKTYEVLTYVQFYFWSENIHSSVLNKNLVLYNHEALNNISKYAIVTDNFIFINSDYFDILLSFDQTNSKFKNMVKKEEDIALFLSQMKRNGCFSALYLGKMLKEMCDYETTVIPQIVEELNVLNFVKNINQEIYQNQLSKSLNKWSVANPIVHISDETFIKYLKDSNLLTACDTFEKEILSINNPNELFDSILDFSSFHKNFVLELKENTVPKFIINYNQMILENDKSHAEVFLEFFLQNINSQIKNFSNLALSITFSAICNHDLFDEINKNIDNQFIKKAKYLFNQMRPDLSNSELKAIDLGMYGFSNKVFLHEILI